MVVEPDQDCNIWRWQGGGIVAQQGEIVASPAAKGRHWRVVELLYYTFNAFFERQLEACCYPPTLHLTILPDRSASTQAPSLNLMWKYVARTCFYQLLHFFEEVLTDRPSINESTLDPDCTSPEAAAVSQLNPEMLNCIPTSTINDILHRVTFLCVDPALLVWIVRLIEVVPEVPTIPHSWKGNLDCVSFIYKTRRNCYPMESHYKSLVSSSSVYIK